MKTIENFQSLAEEINIIFDLLNAFADDDIVIVREKPLKGDKISVTKAILRVYDRATLEAQPADGRHEVAPILRCAFYPHHLYPDRLGSIALYGNRITSCAPAIRAHGQLFGRAVTSIQISMGRRPFLDICLGARVHIPWTKAFHNVLLSLVPSDGSNLDPNSVNICQ